MDTKFNEVLQPVLKEALLSIINEGGHLCLTPEVCQQLLQRPEQDSATSDATGDVSSLVGTELASSTSAPPGEVESGGGLCVLKGYPQYPLYNRLSLSLAYWMLFVTCPVADLPDMYMLNESSTQTERQEKMAAVGALLTGCHGLWDCWSQDERQFTIVTILKELDLRGVLDLVGVRCTVGSVSLLPPSQQVLLATFTSLHSPGSSALLSVGGRALSKHSHRDLSDSWWGVCSGSEVDKNKHALKVALKILKEAAWINIHSLPHDVKVIEVRTIDGYGVRWRHDGSEFRGFLEPQMAEGHTVGWRH